MPVNAGSLRHRLEFFDESFNPLQETGKFYWGSFRTLRGEELHEAQLVWQKTTAEIRSRYFKLGPPGYEFEPYTGCHIKVDGKRNYRIESVINVDEMDEEYIFVVSEV